MEGNALLALALGGFGVAVLLRFWQRRRRRTKPGIEWRQYKARLPVWVKLTELVFQIGFWTGLFFLLLFTLIALHAATHRPIAAPGDNAFGIMVMASLFAALVPGMLLANAMSWLIAPMRRANLEAFEGLPTTSFASANAGLMKLGTVLTPLALAAGIAAAVWG